MYLNIDVYSPTCAHTYWTFRFQQLFTELWLLINVKKLLCQRTSLHKACFMATLDFLFLLTLPAYTTMYRLTCDEISGQSVAFSLTTCMVKLDGVIQ